MERVNTAEVQKFELDHTSSLRSIAPECMVLLKSDGSFPIKPGKIAAYGSGVRHTIKGGTGSGDVNVRSFTTVEQGLLRAGFTLTSIAWLDRYDQIRASAEEVFAQQLRRIAEEGANAFATLGQTMAEPEYDLPLDAEGDTAIYVLARNSGEGADRQVIAGDILLTATEIRDILTASTKYRRFMLVLNTGGMVDLTPVLDKVSNILLLSQLGTPTGDAFADVLCGKNYPSGKLTMTWAPLDVYPSTEGFGDPADTLYREGIFVGYRYFDTFAVGSTFPFGYGLGYTTFSWSTEVFSADENIISWRVTVKNTGHWAGKEVLQLYCSAPEGKLAKPAKELVAYQKTRELAPGEEQILTLSFPTVQLASYETARSAYILEPGIYEFLAGTDSRSVQCCGKVRLDTEVITRQLRAVGCTPDFEDLTPLTSKKEASAEGAISLDADKLHNEQVNYETLPALPQGSRGLLQDVVSGKMTLKQFVGGLTDQEMAWLCVGNYRDAVEGESVMEVIGNASSTLAGAAGETTTRLKKLGIPVVTLADGPAGLRLSTAYTLRDGKATAVLPETEPDGTVYYQYCTAIPIGTALAQAWDAEAARICGDLVGEEMERFGVNIWLAPALNIYRNPLCGRNFEYYSEDPLVAGLTAAAVTEGVQVHPGRATTIKHFCCNNQETNRMHSNSVVSERALREIYLRGFEICIRKAQPHCIMSSYNLLNGVHTNNRYDLQTAVLRDEWGFKGVVMTDWLTTVLLSSREEKYGTASPAGCVKAGNDIIMPGVPDDPKDILTALENPDHPYSLTRAELQLSAMRILRMILLLSGT